MRALILTALLGTALCAQEAPPSQTEKKENPEQQKPEEANPEQAQPPSFFKLPNDLKLRLNPQRPPAVSGRVTVTLAPGQPCAIPLKNVLPTVPESALPQRPYVDPKDRIRVYPPPPLDHSIRIVPLPAPSCDDVKR